MVDVNGAIQVIDLVLKDAGIPARSFDLPWLGIFVETLHTNTAVTRNQRGVSVDAEAAFEKLDFLVPDGCQFRVDDDVERYGRTFAFGDLLGGHCFRILGQIFDDRQLNGQSDLRRGKSDARGVAESLVHVANELLRVFGTNFFDAQFAGALTEYFFADLDEFEAHGVRV